MPRPAIVIGLGGTGSWVLSWLKKDLVETHGTLEGIPVRLLLVDTADVIPDVGLPGVDGADAQGQYSDVSRGQYSRFIIIDRDEFIRIPTSPDVSRTLEIKRAVLNNEPEVSHFSHWFRPEFFPQQSLVALGNGAGQFRQLGRLALVQGIHQDGANDRVYRYLANLIEQTARPVQQGGRREIDVHVVGSFAGGTGSGIFLDMAWLVRKVTPPDVKLFITGFFALPNVWTQNLSMEMRAKTFTAWRELNRVLTVREKHNEFLLQWGGGPYKVVDVKEPAYDHVYLVDPGGRQLENREPEKSIFPIMAEAISFFLDEYSGTNYIQHITSNINKRRTTPQYRNQPTYSTLYVKASKVPVYHFINMTRHDTALAYLDSLLKVEVSPGVDELGNPRSIYSLAYDPLSRNRAGELFDQTLHGAGSTQFITLQAQIRQIEAGDWKAEVQRYARHADMLLQNYAQMSQDPEGSEIRAEIQEVVNYAVPRFESTNNPMQIQDNLNSARIVLFGRSNAGGDYTRLYGDFGSERYKGELYEKLEYVHRFHLQVLRDRIRAWMQRELNVRGGQYSGLSTVLGALRQLAQDLAKSIAFFTDVSKELMTVEAAARRADLTHRRALDKAQNTGLVPTAMNLLGFGAKRAFVEWYQAERKHLSVRRSHRAVERAIDTLEAMEAFVERVALASVREMERQLVSNDDPRLRGVYRGLHESKLDEVKRHGYDRMLGDVIEILGDEEDIPPANPEKVAALLEGTAWEVDEDLNVRLHVELPNRRDPIVLETRPGDRPQSFDLVRQLLESVADPLVRTSDTQSALEFKGVASLVEGLADCQETLYTGDPTHTVQNPYRTFYVRTVADANQANTFDHLLDTKGYFSAQTPEGGGVALVQSENPHKIVVFSANELLLPENFAEWGQCQSDYRRLVIGDRALKIDSHYEAIQCDHLFAAEQNALELEYRYQRLNYGSFPTLGHRLVHLLENRDRLKRFFQLWAIDCVKRVEGRNNAVIWTVVNPKRPKDTIALCPRANNDVLDMIERYVLYGRPMDDAERYIEYDYLHEDLDAVLNSQWLNDNNKRAELLEIYKAESKKATEVGQVLDRVIRRSADEIREALDGQRAPSNARHCLAEELAYDLTRTGERSEDLVPASERDVHLDAIGIVTRLLFEELANDVQMIIDDRSY